MVATRILQKKKTLSKFSSQTVYKYYVWATPKKG